MLCCKSEQIKGRRFNHAQQFSFHLFTNETHEKNTDRAKSGSTISKVLTSDNDSTKQAAKTAFVRSQVSPAETHTHIHTRDVCRHSGEPTQSCSQRCLRTGAEQSSAPPLFYRHVLPLQAETEATALMPTQQQNHG